MNKKDLCYDCYNNFYNQNGKECWHLKNAKIVKRIKVGVFQIPPYHNNPVDTLHCNTPYHYRYIGLNDPRVEK